MGGGKGERGALVRRDYVEGDLWSEEGVMGKKEGRGLVQNSLLLYSSLYLFFS